MLKHSFDRGGKVAAVAVTVLAVGVAAGVPETQAASVYQFERLEANAPVDSSDNYLLTMWGFTDPDDGSDWVSFRVDHIWNVTEITQASITSVFFQDLGNLFWDGSTAGSLTGVFNADESHPDVQFTDPAVTLSSLPGGAVISFDTSYSSGAQQPQPNENAINLDEWAQFDLKLFGDSTFEDVQSQILDEFMVGLHVRNIEVEGYDGPDDNWSDSFAIVPLPAAGWAGAMLLGALGGAAGVRRRCRG